MKLNLIYGRLRKKNKLYMSTNAESRILELWYVKDATLSQFSENESYSLISARNTSIDPEPIMLSSGIDIALSRLHIDNAPERRKLLGLKKDTDYEIMVSFEPLVLVGTENQEPLKVRYGKMYNIAKEDAAPGFTYKKMFYNLKMKESLNFNVKLVEIDNEKVDPDPLRELLNDTGIGTVLDLSPYNPKQYLQLASNVVTKIQDVFGSDRAGDDNLWDDTLTMEAKPTIPGSYRLREGFYVIVENNRNMMLKPEDMVYQNNLIKTAATNTEIKTNYLVFSVGKTISNMPA